MRLSLSSMMARVASSGASVPRIHQEASLWGPCFSPRIQLRRVAVDFVAHGEGLVARDLRLWTKIWAKGGAVYRDF
jgi:hypothetical protein